MSEYKSKYADLSWARENIYCPVCGKKLIKKQSIDIYAKELICESDHWFYVPERMFYAGDTITAREMKIPSELKTDIQIIKYWLTDETARPILNAQLAEILVRIFNYFQTAKHIPTDLKAHFYYCVLCGEKLEQFEPKNLWVSGLTCPNKHQCFERSYRISFSDGEERGMIYEEMQDGILVQLLKSWANPKSPDQDSNIHQSLKDLFNKFIQTFEPIDSTGTSKG